MCSLGLLSCLRLLGPKIMGCMHCHAWPLVRSWVQDHRQTELLSGSECFGLCSSTLTAWLPISYTAPHIRVPFWTLLGLVRVSLSTVSKLHSAVRQSPCSCSWPCGTLACGPTVLRVHSFWAGYRAVCTFWLCSSHGFFLVLHGRVPEVELLGRAVTGRCLLEVLWTAAVCPGSLAQGRSSPATPSSSCSLWNPCLTSEIERKPTVVAHACSQPRRAQGRSMEEFKTSLGSRAKHCLKNK